MKKPASRLEEMQELLDAGYSPSKVASKMGIHHTYVDRAIKRCKLEIYVPFDELLDKVESCDIRLVPYDEWDCEDALDDIVRRSFLFEKVHLNEYDEVHRLSAYVRDKYKTLKRYLRFKKATFAYEHVYSQCSVCRRDLPLSDFHGNIDSRLGIRAKCTECSRHITIAAAQRRRTRINFLRDDFSPEDALKLRSDFGGRCVFTGSLKYALDHVIPVVSGHGGTYYGNLIPLRKDLNSSKNDKNIFEWFEANRQRFELDQSRFDSLIAKLAEQNDMTTEEYREYVYWCHDNPAKEDAA